MEETGIRYTKSGKIDKRSLNGGRGVKKENNPKLQNTNNVAEPQVTENTFTTTQTNNTQMPEQNSNPVDNTQNNTPIDNTQNNTPVNTGEEDRFKTAENVDIIDESKLSNDINPEDKVNTPVSEPVVVEDYRNPYKGQVGEGVTAKVAEFVKPNIDQIKNQMFGGGAGPQNNAENKNADTVNNQTQNTTQNTGQSTGTNQTIKSALENPDLKFATPQERTQGAEQLVDGALGLYEKINQFGAWVAQISIEKKKEDELDGKIDLQFQIPVDPENPAETISLEQFIVQYNNECKKAIVVTQDFIDKVRPVMIRVCEKNGWGLTDEQYLIYMFGRDILEKAAMIWGMKRQMNASLRMIAKFQAHIKNQDAGTNQTQNNNQQQSNGSGPSTEQSQNYRSNVVNNEAFGFNKKPDDVIVPEVVGEEETKLPSLTINESKENPDLNLNKQ